MILDNKITTHKEILRQLIDISDELILISPFLAQNISVLLDSLGVSKCIRKITLVTVLKAFEQALIKPFILHNFISYCELNNITYQLLCNDKLHSKIYLFKYINTLHSAIITSANFTRTGLCENHETGIIVNDNEYLLFLERHSMQSCISITSNEVNNLCIAAKKYKSCIKIEKNKSPHFDSYQYIGDKDNALHIYPDRDYYIKPIGCTEMPYDKHEPISPKLHFSKQKPRVRIGDILICYAVGLDHHLLGYYEIRTKPEWDDTDERWPWYVMGDCLSQGYSEHFWKTNITLTQAVKDYNQQHPGEPVTASGNTKLRALQWGKDKVKLDKDFADYLISLIDFAPIKK